MAAGLLFANNPWKEDEEALVMRAMPLVLALLLSTSAAQSDEPTPGGAGRAQNVVELMDHLEIERDATARVIDMYDPNGK